MTEKTKVDMTTDAINELSTKLADVATLARKHQKSLIRLNSQVGKAVVKQCQLFAWFRETKAWSKVGLGYETWEAFCSACGYTRQHGTRLATLGENLDLVEPLLERGIGQELVKTVVQAKAALEANENVGAIEAHVAVQALVDKAVAEKQAPAAIKEAVVALKNKAAEQGYSEEDVLTGEIVALIKREKLAVKTLERVRQELASKKARREEVRKKK